LPFSAAVSDFANELENLLSGALSKKVSFKVLKAPLDNQEWKFSLTTKDMVGVPICIDSVVVFYVQIFYNCAWNNITERITILESSYTVWMKDVKEPLWRYDYVRDMSSKAPIAHLNVHAHRDEIVWAMSLKKKKSVHDLKIQKLHFPFGGARFRPTIEDVLQMLIEEFDIDKSQNAKSILEESRVRYFERQLHSAVIDSPGVAIEALEKLGYAVSEPSEKHLTVKTKKRKTSF